MDLERREVIFVGRVQGVGFRFTTKEIATRFDVTGWVKNLANGDVAAVVEGKPAEIDAFLQAVESAMRGNIDEMRATVNEHSGRFEGFEIVR